MTQVVLTVCSAESGAAFFLYIYILFLFPPFPMLANQFGGWWGFFRVLPGRDAEKFLHTYAAQPYFSDFFERHLQASQPGSPLGAAAIQGLQN